ncbi:MAG: hypothetical protein QG614_425 [Patescibacteria group bacterium]|nr:hypothetical protein [Patescibacteria group bacterium]
MNNIKNKDVFTDVVQIASTVKPQEPVKNQQVVADDGDVINLNQSKYKTS